MRHIWQAVREAFGGAVRRLRRPRVALTVPWEGVDVRAVWVTRARLPYWIGAKGMAFTPSRVLLRGHHAGITAPLVAHEFCHLLQWRRYGVWGFLARYVGGLLRHGYGLRHPMEREAYDFAVQHAERFQPVVIALRVGIEHQARAQVA